MRNSLTKLFVRNFRKYAIKPSDHFQIDDYASNIENSYNAQRCQIKTITFQSSIFIYA